MATLVPIDYTLHTEQLPTSRPGVQSPQGSLSGGGDDFNPVWRSPSLRASVARQRPGTASVAMSHFGRGMDTNLYWCGAARADTSAQCVSPCFKAIRSPLPYSLLLSPYYEPRKGYGIFGKWLTGAEVHQTSPASCAGKQQGGAPSAAESLPDQ